MYIVDNSVWQRLGNPTVREALSTLVMASSTTPILICPPVAAEVGYSARSGADHDVVASRLREFSTCPLHPSVGLVLAIQGALFNRGLVRAVGATDAVIAAYAIVNDATVLHYDRGFEHVAHVWRRFEQEWIAPRGSLES